MKATNLLPLAAMLCISLLSNCSKTGGENVSIESAAADTVASIPDVATDSTYITDTSKRAFVKTASFSGQVKDVKLVSNQLATWVKRMSGFVAQNELRSEVIRLEETPISNDSLEQNKIYVITNDLELHVPTLYLDSLLQLVQEQMIYIDEQNTEASDVSLALLSSQFKKARFSRFEHRYQKNLNQTPSKIKEKLSGEENLYEMQNQADANAIATWQLKEQVAFSTVRVHLYQHPLLARTNIPDTENNFAFRPSFWIKLTLSLQTGWYVFIDVLLGLLKLWVLFVLGGIAFWLYKKKKISV